MLAFFFFFCLCFHITTTISFFVQHMSAGSSPPCSTPLLWLAQPLLLQLCSWHLGLVGLQSSSQSVLGRLGAGKFSSVQEKRRIMGTPRDEYCLSVTGELKEHGSCSHKAKTARSWLLSLKKTNNILGKLPQSILKPPNPSAYAEVSYDCSGLVWARQHELSKTNLGGAGTACCLSKGL